MPVALRDTRRSPITALNARFTVRRPRRGSPLTSTTTFSAGERIHAVNSPSDSTDGSSQTSPRAAKNDQYSFKSCAYARTVFGERSICASHARYRSTGPTGR